MGAVGMGPPELMVPIPLLLLGGCCHHSSAFPPHHPVGWLQGEARLHGEGRWCRNGDSRWHRKEKPKPFQLEQHPSQSLWEAGGGHKHTSERRNHQEKRVLREAQMSLPLRNARVGFCICPNLALSLWKGLFVKCFVFVSLALISPRRSRLRRSPRARRCASARPALSHPPTWQVPSSAGLSQRMSKGLKSA